MHWTPFRFFALIALTAAPFLTPCSRPAQPTPGDRAAIEKLAAHLRRTESLDDHHTKGRWLVFSSGAAAAGRNYAHIPILQIGGVKETADQDRILATVQAWEDKSRFSAVTIYFYGDPRDPEEPSSALTNLLRTQRAELGQPKK